jgi:hypothetical protein
MNADKIQRRGWVDGGKINGRRLKPSLRAEWTRRKIGDSPLE